MIFSSLLSENDQSPPDAEFWGPHAPKPPTIAVNALAVANAIALVDAQQRVSDERRAPRRPIVDVDVPACRFYDD